MTPTLAGRIETRLFLLATVGAGWTLILGLLLPRAVGVTLREQYWALFTALLIVTVAGVVWELLYHGLQQFRWEKDWPSVFGLATAVPEGMLTWLLLQAGLPWDVGRVSGWTFLIMFVSVWLLVWSIANGPLQIVLLRWRYRGGLWFGDW